MAQNFNPEYDIKLLTSIMRLNRTMIRLETKDEGVVGSFLKGSGVASEGPFPPQGYQVKQPRHFLGPKGSPHRFV